MLSSIHPLGERGRHNRWGVTATAFALGASLAGAVAGAGAGWIGGIAFGGAGWRWPAVAAVAIAAGAADLARVKPPGPRRQVNEDWIGTYRGWVYGVGFGAQLGVGVATYVVTWGVWATALMAVLTASPLTGAVVGACFGMGRGLVPLAGRWIDRPSRLTAFNRAMARLAVPVARTVAVGLVVAGAVGVVA